MEVQDILQWVAALAIVQEVEVPVTIQEVEVLATTQEVEALGIIQEVEALGIIQGVEALAIIREVEALDIILEVEDQDGMGEILATTQEVGTVNGMVETGVVAIILVVVEVWDIIQGEQILSLLSTILPKALETFLPEAQGTQ